MVPVAYLANSIREKNSIILINKRTDCPAMREGLPFRVSAGVHASVEGQYMTK
jgi:hypothetical protein